MALKATVQGGAGKARNRGLQGLEAVVERQEDVPPKVTAMTSSSAMSTVKAGFGPIAVSITVVRLRYLATVLGLRSCRAASVCRLS